MTSRGRKLHFTEATLNPRVVIEADDDLERAIVLHDQAHEDYFIANSVAFPVFHRAIVTYAS